MPPITSGMSLWPVRSARQPSSPDHWFPFSCFESLREPGNQEYRGLGSSRKLRGFDHKFANPQRSTFGANLTPTGPKMLSKSEPGRGPRIVKKQPCL